MSDQVVVVRLPAELARRVRLFVETDSAAYGSVQEFIRVAVENQLNLQMGDVASEEPDLTGADPFPVLKQPPQKPPGLLEPVDALDTPLFHMTNRLAPLKVAVRVLANLLTASEKPKLKEFHRRAAGAARALGLKLRMEDVASQGAARRAVGFPIGGNPELSMARFVNSFTLWKDGDRSAGPLAVLGLAGVVDGHAALTERGWRLAALPTPMLKETSGAVLSSAEADEFRAAIRAAPAERSEVRAFLDIVRSTGGRQSGIDRKLKAEHQDWSENRVVAHRAALVGRLADVAAIVAEGRGASARIIEGPGAKDIS